MSWKRQKKGCIGTEEVGLQEDWEECPVDESEKTEIRVV
jgi:hypothetical protein